MSSGIAYEKESGVGTRLGRWIGSIFIWAVVRLAPLLPLRVMYCLGKLSGDLLYFTWISRRRIAINNLRLAFGGEKDPRQLRLIARQVYGYLMTGLCEAVRFVLLPAEHLDRRLTVEGRENLVEALKEGRGVIAFSAHLGCFPLMGRKLAGEGFPFNYVIRFPKDVRLTNYLKQLSQRVGVKFISTKPERHCASHCLEALRRNEVVCLLGDQRTREGVVVDFFGHPVLAATGPVVLSLRTGAKILPMFIVRRSDRTHQLIINSPFALEITEDREKDILINTARLTRLIESYVRRYPTQWAWIHRRWR
ncbi:hypothetical protein KAU86_05335 [bacterium]|nr:hypothetical protein [bacterium]